MHETFHDEILLQTDNLFEFLYADEIHSVFVAFLKQLTYSHCNHMGHKL
jgi:hypothetical protein